MDIVIEHPAKLTRDDLGTSVVIDVLRATTTATVLTSRGANEMFAVESPADLDTVIRGEESKYLIVSELDEIEPGPNRIDNSPVTAGSIELAGRVPILVTTNGTRALSAAAQRSDIVLIASFLNLASVAAHIQRAAPKKVTILPAGKFADAAPRTEDTLCAEMLKRVLLGEDPRQSEVIERIREDEIVQRRLKRPGFAADLDLSLTPNRYHVVPFVAGDRGAPARICIVRTL